MNLYILYISFGIEIQTQGGKQSLLHIKSEFLQDTAKLSWIVSAKNLIKKGVAKMKQHPPSAFIAGKKKKQEN